MKKTLCIVILVWTCLNGVTQNNDWINDGELLSSIRHKLNMLKVQHDSLLRTIDSTLTTLEHKYDSAYEPKITSGTSFQYLDGTKSWRIFPDIPVQYWVGLDGSIYLVGGNSAIRLPKSGKIDFGNLGYTFHSLFLSEDSTGLSTDGNFSASGTVTGTNLNILNWNTAFGWGPHSGRYWLYGDTGAIKKLAAYHWSVMQLALKANLSAPHFTGSGVQVDSTIYTTIKPSVNSSTAVTLDFALGNKQIVTITGSCTVTLKNCRAGPTYTIEFRHEASTTAYTVAFSPAIKWPAGVAPVFPNTDGAISTVTFYEDGTNYIGGYLMDQK